MQQNRRKPPPEIRFHNLYIPEPNTGCWLWTNALDKDGYGFIFIDRKTSSKRAHRFSWALHNGKIPYGGVIMHKCDTPSCVNPEHLVLGTHADNIFDKTSKHRHHNQKKAQCPNGHRYDRVVCGIRRCSVCTKKQAMKNYFKRREDPRWVNYL